MERILVPDVGEAEDVEVIEILVAVGDTVAADDSLVALESDKASMEIPAPMAGRVTAIAVAVGDNVVEGDLILELDVDGPTDGGSTPEPDTAGAEPPADVAAESTEDDQAASAASDTVAVTAATSTEVPVAVPDVGDADEVIAIEWLVAPGDQVVAGQSLVVLESDKASMEIEAPAAGTVVTLLVAEGAEVREGDILLTLATSAAEPAAAKPAPAAATAAAAPEPATALPSEPGEAAVPAPAVPAPAVSAPAVPAPSGAAVHAGPAVRRQAREYGVDLAAVTPTGPSGRVLKEDVMAFVKARLAAPTTTESGGSGIPSIPAIDFSKFGPVHTVELSRIRRQSAKNLHRSWLNVPHVTQFDEADITDLEAFRREQNAALGPDGVKVTPLAFLVRAITGALAAFPEFNASLAPDGEHLIMKAYCHVGIAVETPDGLVVPVIRDADRMSITELASASATLAAKARDKKLGPADMQGASFTISSLGGIGGTAFTPIVNAPEVAILGVSRSAVKPVWNGTSFEPRTMLPLSLSYDHRVIDGAAAARFTTWLKLALEDLRRLLM